MPSNGSRHFVLCTLVSVSAISVAASSYAAGESERDPWTPLGVNVRTLTVHPGLAFEKYYDSNIYRDASHEKSDYVAVLKPSISAKTNWSRHRVQAYAKGAFSHYMDHTDESTQDYAVGLSGRYDIMHETYLHGRVDHTQTHEDRSSPDDANADEPTKIHTTDASLGFTRALAKLQLHLNGRMRDISYDDSISNGTRIDNSDRDRKAYEADVKLAYEFQPKYMGFIRFVYDRRSYDDPQTNNDRSSNGARYEIGTDVNLSGKLKASLYGGVIYRDYKTGFKGVNTGTFGTSLLWSVNGLTRVMAEIGRDVWETTLAGASSYIRTQNTLGIEHDFAKNVTVKIGASATYDDFIGIGYKEETYGAKASVVYKPFRGATAGLHYNYKDRHADNPDNEYIDHIMMLRLGYIL